MAKEEKKDKDLELETSTTTQATPTQPDLILDQFDLLLNELLDQFKAGETGKIIIPVEVVRAEKEKVRFRKNGEAEVFGSFRNKTVSEMREDIGVVED